MKSKLFIIGVFLLSVSVLAQSGGQFAISQSVVAGGGGHNSSGGTFSIAGTIGQTTAGTTSVGGFFALDSGFWTSNRFAGIGLEADVAPRTGGDGLIQSNDVIQVQRFQIGLDQPLQTNELQRADSAPFASRGDNLLQSNDVVQTQRYLIGLDALQNAAGPGAFFETVQPNTEFNPEEKAVFDHQKPLPEKNGAVLAHRRMYVQNASTNPGQQVQVNILADADGDESSYGFRVNYNQAILTNPVTAIGTAGGSRLCSTATAGQINCSIINFPDNNPTSSTDQIGEINAGNNQLLLRITFTVAANAGTGTTPITLSNVNASDDAAANLPITSQDGTVTILGPTAASVSVAGRVTTAYGQGIRNARITLTGANGAVRVIQTGSFGYYRFDEVEVGQTYVLQISSKRFVFANPTRVLNIQEELTDADWIAEK